MKTKKNKIIGDKENIIDELTNLTNDYRLEKSIIIDKESAIKNLVKERKNIFVDTDISKNSFVEKIKSKNIILEIEEVKQKNNSLMNRIRRFFGISIK